MRGREGEGLISEGEGGGRDGVRVKRLLHLLGIMATLL